MCAAQAGRTVYRDERYDRYGAEWLKENLANRPLVMQGPMGSQLLALGGEGVPTALWNIAEPQEVARLHALYRAVGADITLTNTFQASAPALERDGVGQSMERINRVGVALAQKAGAPCVMGSIGPCGVAPNPEDPASVRSVRAAYREQAYALLDAGASALMLETFTHLSDAMVALEGALDVAFGMPVLLSFSVREDCCLLGDGTPLEGACSVVAAAGAASVGVNCCGLEVATACVPRMVAAVSVPVSVRPCAGLPHRDEGGHLVWDEEPDAFAQACVEWCAQGARLVGSCCGATARTTCALAACIEER